VAPERWKMMAEEVQVVDVDEHVLMVLDREEGDKRIKWKPSDSASVAKAKKLFEEYRAKGCAMIRLTPKGSRKKGEVLAVKTSNGAEFVDRFEGESIKRFEPDRDIAAVPPRRGG
jgi:hypothetical protein